MRALLVVNPKATATTARARDVLASALASASRLEVVQTKARGHGAELAAAAVDEFDLVVALGGDGTVNEVVNGLLSGGVRPGVPALAVVPGGSTNVFARALGLPHSPVEATGVLLDALAAERRRSIGLGRAVGAGSPARWFTFNAGLGLDGAVVRRVDAARTEGRRPTPTLYARKAVRAFSSLDRRHPALTLRREGCAPERLALALVCNTRPWTYVGSRALDPAPRAGFDTGLDVFGLRRLALGPLLRHTAQALADPPHATGPDVLLVHDADRLVLSAPYALPLQLDGEDVGDHDEVSFTGVPAALSVVL